MARFRQGFVREAEAGSPAGLLEARTGKGETVR